MKLSRRSLFAATTTALVVPHAAWAQEKVVRYGIPMTDIPLTTGQPDRGANAYQYTGHTIYDPLIAWELDVSDRPGKMIPGLATEWKVDEADKTLWTFKLRPGVKFHDGSAFDADAVIWNLEKVFNKDAPQFDTRQSAQVRPRLPGLLSYSKTGDMEIEIKTKSVDSLFPYQLLWFLVSSPAQWEKLGKDWNKFADGAVGHRPVQARPLRAARTRRAGEERGLLESQAHSQGRPLRPGLRAGRFQPQRRADLRRRRHDRRAGARRGGSAEAERRADRRATSRRTFSSIIPRWSRDRRGPTSGCARRRTSRSTAMRS